MIAPSEADAVLMADLLQRRLPVFTDRLTGILRENRVTYAFLQGPREMWGRDYMPLQVGDREFVRFVFSPRYLRHAPELVTRPSDVRCPDRLIAWGTWKRSRIVLDGGNVVTGDGRHVVVSDFIYGENPEWGRNDSAIASSDCCTRIA